MHSTHRGVSARPTAAGVLLLLSALLATWPVHAERAVCGSATCIYEWLECCGEKCYDPSVHVCSEGLLCFPSAPVACKTGTSHQCCNEAQVCLSTGCANDCPAGLARCGAECCDASKRCDPETKQCVPEVPPPPPRCEGPKCECSPTLVGDPVNIAQGASHTQVVDVDLPGGLAPLRFIRSYSSRGDEWAHDTPLPHVAPFGFSPTPGALASETSGARVHWWHNHLSMVTRQWAERDSSWVEAVWSVRAPDGVLRRFEACQGVPCQAAPTRDNASIRERLRRTATGFVLVMTDGQRLVFEAPYQGGRQYYLSRVIASSGATAVTLRYRQPADARCPVAGEGSAPGMPFLAELETPEARLVVGYRALENTSQGVECVIDSLSLQEPATGALTPLVTYVYTSEGGAKRPGRIASATWASRSERYEYSDTDFRQTSSTGAMVRHVYGQGSTYGGAVVGALVQSTEAPGEALQVQWDPYVVQGTYCGAAARSRRVTDLTAGRGDGADGGSGFTRTYETVTHLGQLPEPRLLQVTDSCTVSGACSPGSVRTEWKCSTETTPGHEWGRKDKRDHWEVYEYQLSSTDGGVPPALERVAVKRGASGLAGSDALEETRYAYTYGTHGAQLLAASEQASVLGPAGSRARQAYAYEPETDRQRASIRSGWTRVRQPDGTWTTERRFIGTFSFTSRVSSGETEADCLGRVLEEQGPCSVEDETATACPEGPAPLRQYHYWPESEPSPRRNRLKAIHTYAARGAAPLVVSFNAYDERGNATEVVDENGVVTRFTYEEDRVTSSTVGTRSPTTYGYDQTHLTSVRHPEGNFDVFCYRKDTPTAACAGGVLTDKLQWKAKAEVADGSLWSEKVTYSGWPDGTVREEQYLTWNGQAAEVRRVVRFAADAHKRPAWQQFGQGPGAYRATKGFDGADNVVAVGEPFNRPPAWCDTSATNSSVLCSHLRYDRANRLTQLDEFPTASTTAAAAQRTCLSHDAQGNVTTVRTGCGTDTACASCTAPAAHYTYDDFGQVVEARLPQAEGPVRYAYDAQGNTFIKETEAMRRDGEYLAYAYDALSRQLSARRVTSGPAAQAETLYRFGYDDLPVRV